MSAHTASLARTLGWMLLPIATLFGVLVLKLPCPSDRGIELVAGLFAASVCCIAAPILVPYAVRLITAWKGAPKP